LVVLWRQYFKPCQIKHSSYLQMSIVLGQAIRQNWSWTDARLLEFANANFSDDMMAGLARQNQLRLANRSQAISLRSRIIAMHYLPFGLIPARATRTNIQFQHYATNKSVSKYSFGNGRFDFFFHQLNSSDWVRQASPTQQYAVAVSLQLANMVPTNWGQLVRTDFGTSDADLPGGALQTVSFATPPTFPFNMFLRPNATEGTLLVTSPFRNRGSGSLLSFVSNLKAATESVLPQNRESGVPEDYRIVQLFLVVLAPQVGGGGASGTLTLTAAPATSMEWIVNPKALLTPTRWEQPTCLWECLMAALCIRQEASPEAFTDATDLWMKDMCVKSGLTARQREGQMKRIQWNVLAFMEWCRQHGIQIASGPVSVDDVATAVHAFGFHSVNVLDASGHVLAGECADLHLKRAESNHLVLMYRDAHYSLVMSYTALLPVKECTACGERFSSEKTLKVHLEKRVCLVCECVTFKQRTPFTSEAMWRHHRANLHTDCLFRLSPPAAPALSRKEERERLAKRFPHDKVSEKRYKRWSTSPSNQAAILKRELERDMHPIRNWKEALYVDLESVVPFNGLNTERTEIGYQQAYAIGWLRRSDALRGCDPSIVYGMDCMFHFFAMLDQWWEDIVCDEARVWMDRCEADLILSPNPDPTSGNENYANRLKKSWERMQAEKAECGVCGLSFEHECHRDGFRSACAKTYWSRNTAVKNCMQDFNDNAPRVTIWAHNGGRYDWLFVHRYLMEHNLLSQCRVVRGGGRYYEIVYRGIFVFRDSLNFMMGSLDRLGQDFKVETLKGVFPYEYLQRCSMIEDVLDGEACVRSALPPSMFQLSQKVDGPMGLVVKRAMTEEEYVDFMSSRGWRYDVKVETCKYLADDIKCLSQVMECFRNGWQEMPYQPELFQYCTIGQMCHTYFLQRFLDPGTYPTLDVMEDAFIRRALFGGRTEVFQRCVTTPERIHYVDVNSLYPFVMESRFLPSGDPVWHFCADDERVPLFRASAYRIKLVTHGDLDSVKERLNACDLSLYGFFEVDVQCAQDMHYPVLPERVNDKNMFTNCFKTKMVYYSEELKFAIARGCRVVRVHAWSQWVPRKVYSRCIQVLKAEKMRGEGKDVHGNLIPGAPKNPSLRAAAKTAQNALYGKSIQYINESVQIVDNQDDLFKLVRTAESDVSVQPIYRSGDLDIVEVVVKPHKPRVQPRSCSAIGTAILAEARMVLYTYFEEVSKVGGTILYCDTDSIVYAGDEVLPEHCLSDAEYGKMKVEIDPEDIVPGGFVALAPKCYSFLLKDGSPYVKCKGVNLASNVAVGAESALDELLELFDEEDMLQELVGTAEAEDSLSGLSFDHLRMMVMGEKRKIVTRQKQFLKTRDRHVACIDTVKLLKDEFDKRWILEGGVTVPWSDINRDIITAVERMDVSYVSNFLQSASVLELQFVDNKFRDHEWFRLLWNSWLDSGEFSAEYFKSQM
jgi:hypothetical protein